MDRLTPPRQADARQAKALCLQCDSLGSHRVAWDETPADDWLACIDCDTVLARLTPELLQPRDAEPERNEAGGGLQRSDFTGALLWLAEQGQARDCQRASAARAKRVPPTMTAKAHQLAAQAGLLPPRSPWT